MYVYIYIYIYIYIHIHIISPTRGGLTRARPRRAFGGCGSRPHTYIYIYIYVCMCICIYIYIHTHVYIYIYAYIHTYNNNTIYIHITYIYIYIYTHRDRMLLYFTIQYIIVYRAVVYLRPRSGARAPSPSPPREGRRRRGALIAIISCRYCYQLSESTY